MAFRRICSLKFLYPLTGCRESGEQEGTGIGLVISQELLASMGGIIKFKSEENVGSHFWIELDSSFFDEAEKN